MEQREKKPLIEYLPEFLRKYREYRYICGAEQLELDEVGQRIFQVLENRFVDSCDLKGIERLEKAYKIIPPDDAGMEARKLAIKVKKNKKLPYTYRQLESMIMGLCGADNCKVVLNHKEYDLFVKVRARLGNGKELLAAVDETVNQVKPCNLTYDSALFDYKDCSITTYTGIACSTYRRMNVEVIG